MHKFLFYYCLFGCIYCGCNSQNENSSLFNETTYVYPKLFYGQDSSTENNGDSPKPSPLLQSSRQTLYSTSIKDSFWLYVHLPKGYQKDNPNPYPMVYYLDATINSGKAVQQKIVEWETAGKLTDAIWIGIGHTGYYGDCRQRDFIQAYIKNSNGKGYYSDSDWYGQSERFFQFFRQQLIPHIEKQVNGNARNRSLIGHSLGGLFAMYCVFHEQNPFKQIAAFSPSIWVNYENLYDFEAAFRQKHKTLPIRLYLAAGTGETWNYILSGNQKMHQHLTDKPYQQLDYTYRELEGQSHNSMVDVALEEVFAKWFAR